MAANRNEKTSKVGTKPVPVKIQLQTSESTASYYCNFVEVAHTPYEFSLSFAKIQPKLKPEQVALAKAGQPLFLDAMLQVEIPITLIPGILRALNMEKRKFEKRFGKIKTTG